MELFLIVLQFLLVLIPEPILPIEDHTEVRSFLVNKKIIVFFPQREPCPEESASFLSRIT